MTVLRGNGRHIQIFKTLCILCVCVFCVYQIQETALNKFEENRLLQKKQPPILSAYDVHLNSKTDLKTHEESLTTDLSNDVEGGLPIWVTMAVCWSENSHYHGKDNFPYVASVPLSTQLWLKTTDAKVVVQIVYAEAEVSEKLQRYKEELESYGALVKLVETKDVKCVLKSQIIRVLAFLLPEIPDNAVIVTADVDALIMTSKILLPIKKLPTRKIWVYRYAFTHVSGSTFNMPFIGAYSKTWREILEYDSSNDDLVNGILGNGISKMIATYNSYMNFSESYTWDIDQHIVSYAIMKNKLCTLPSENNLWKQLALEPIPLFDDQETCWHGDGTYEDCNNVLWTRNVMIRYKGGSCKWWHFYPSEDYSAVRSKFHEILAHGDYEDGILNAILKSAKEVQRQAFGHLVV